MSDWSARLVPDFETDWPEGLERFVEWQAARWPRLSSARQGLDAVRTRSVPCGAGVVQVQWNPGRTVNTTAKVDPASIASRACFLCPDRLPPEEHGIAFDDLVVLCNPAPILAGHLVLAHREHRPQEVRPIVGALLAFAQAAAGRFTAVYNGPRSGASAPDHLHLQAVTAGLLPEERAGAGRHGRWMDTSSGRLILGLTGPRESVERDLRVTLETLALAQHVGEPDVNLLATAHDDGVLALLFPRGAHRPACFFAEGEGQCIVSPGAIDMAGVIVTVREADFERLDRAWVEGIFAETTLGPRATRALRATLERSWNHD